MESLKLVAEVNITLEAAMLELTDSLQQNNFSIVSKVDLNITSQTDQKWNRYILIRSRYPKENLINEYLATPARNIVRCSMLIQGISKSKIRVELSRSNRSVYSQEETCQIMIEADQKLNGIMKTLRNLAADLHHSDDDQNDDFKLKIVEAS